MAAKITLFALTVIGTEYEDLSVPPEHVVLLSPRVLSPTTLPVGFVGSAPL
jgi:hypothetical protein